MAELTKAHCNCHLNINIYVCATLPPVGSEINAVCYYTTIYRAVLLNGTLGSGFFFISQYHAQKRDERWLMLPCFLCSVPRQRKLLEGNFPSYLRGLSSIAVHE